MKPLMHAAVAALLIPFTHAQDAAAPAAAETHDLRVGLKVGQKVLIELDSSIKTTMNLTLPNGDVTTMKLAGEDEARFIDEITSLHDEGFAAARSIVDWKSEENGEIKDPDIVGQTFDIEYVETPRIAVREGGRASKDSLHRLLQSVPATGLWVPLPAQLAIGESCEVNLVSVIALMAGLDQEPTEHQSTLTLDAVDEEGVASLSGTMSTAAPMDDDGVKISALLGGDVTMRVDLAAGQVIEVTWDGEGTFEGGAPGVDMEGTAEFKARVTATAGAAADRAAKRKPTYRNTVRDMRGMGLKLDLPSHWFHFMTADNGTEVYVSFAMTDEVEGPRNLEIRAFATADPKATIEAAEKTVQKSFAGMKFKNLSTKLGKGRSGTGETDKGRAVVVDLVGDGDRVVQLRFETSPKDLKKAMKDLERARKTLRRVK